MRVLRFGMMALVPRQGFQGDRKEEHSALNRQVVGSIPTASTITSIK